MKTIFQTRVISIGQEAANMIEEANMLILFGAEAPADLAEYCYQIDNQNLTGSIQSGGILVIDDTVYPITAVGQLVERNLSTLGHITIAFDGSRQESLPGTLHVEAGAPVILGSGSCISLQV